MGKRPKKEKADKPNPPKDADAKPQSNTVEVTREPR